MERPWFWEGNVQRRVVEDLKLRGYTILRVADPGLKERGRDIEARATDGTTLWLSVKGFPEKRPDKPTSPSTQARHWFAEALFDLIIYRGEDSKAALGIALPSGFQTYQSLAQRVRWFRNSVPFRFYWVEASGTVRED